MKKLRFSLRTLLVVAPALAIAAAVVLKAINATTVYDATSGMSSTCEIHNVAMKTKLVGITYGMRIWTPTDEARQKLFPHADEVYDTGFCMPIQQDMARVHVCSKCSDAREKWLKKNP